MNFEWMVGAIDTQLAFWLLGVGSLVVGVLLILRVVVRGSPSGWAAGLEEVPDAAYRGLSQNDLEKDAAGPDE